MTSGRLTPAAATLINTSSGPMAGVGRSTGTFLHPDPFGIFMGFMAAFLVPLAVTRGVRYRGLVLLAMPLVGLALLSSYTRTGWVGFLFGMAVLGLVVALAVLRGATVLRLIPLEARRFRTGCSSTGSVEGSAASSWGSAWPPGAGLRSR